MLATKRRFEPSVIQRLLDEPYRFHFFQAVRMLELWLKRNDVPHADAVSDYLRFRNTLSLRFPPSEIEALRVDSDCKVATDRELLEALNAGKLNFIGMTPSFMGFLGSSGALPAHYTERIASHQLYERDESPRAFLDTFSNRAVALFYEAWRKYRIEYKYELDGEDRFLPLLKSFAGIGHRSLEQRLVDDEGGVLDETLGCYAAAMRHRPASTALMQKVLQEYFAVPISLQQFIGFWYEVPEEQQTMLGSESAVLGATAMAGARVWQRDLRMRLSIGPLCQSDFDAFLPHGRAAKALEKMLTMFTGVCLEYEVQLVLRAQDVRNASLGSQPIGGRLGWDTFMSLAEKNDRSDVCYQIHAL
jgi:type VI secretion system protein ImpH